MKWLPKLMGYDYEVVYKKGLENEVADALFRFGSGNELLSMFMSSIITDLMKKVQDTWLTHDVVGTIITNLRNGQPAKHYAWVNENLLRKSKLAVGQDANLRRELLKYFHKDSIGGLPKLHGKDVIMVLVDMLIYHPQTDGQTEVVTRCLEGYLRCMSGKQPKKWIEWLPLAELWCNTNFHTSINTTPFEVNRMKQQADKLRSEREFFVGDMVFLKLEPHRQVTIRMGKQNKFSQKFYGPFEVSAKDNASSGKLVNVQIPTPLITHLVNYCEYITHMGKLVKLPCSPNVDDILTLYLDHRSNIDDRAYDSAGELMSGLRCYFDKALPAMLLYTCERQQYEEATANGVSPSKIYGAEHLLRLFVKLPEILYYANIEEETLIELQHKLQDFLKYDTLKML
ncbi:chromo/chromo shadow domain, MRG domain protein [Tanacetum coccineum]